MSQTCNLQSSWRSMVRDGIIAALLAVAFSWVIRSGFTPQPAAAAESLFARPVRPAIHVTP